MKGEEVHHFRTGEIKGGCALLGRDPTIKSGRYWILISNQRVLYEAWVKQTTEKYTRSSGSIPLSKISYVGTAIEEPAKGCAGMWKSGCASLMQRPRYVLRINSSGGDIYIAVLTEQEANELQNVIYQLISAA